MKKNYPSLTPEALRLMARMQHLLAQDGIHVAINEPDSHLHLIEIADKFNDPELRQCGLDLKEQTLYSQRIKSTIERMQSILSSDGILIDMKESNAVNRLISYAEHFHDKELKKLGRQLKQDFSRA